MDSLLEMTDWVFFALQVANGVVSTIIITYALVRILPPQNPWPCWICALAITLSFLIVKQAMDPRIYALLSTTFFVGGYLVFLGGPLIVRIVVNVIAQVILLFAEIPAGIIWIALTKSPVMDVAAGLANMPAYVVVSVFHAAMAALLFHAFYRGCTNVLRACRYRFSENQNTLWSGVFVSFPIVQLALLSFALSISFVTVGDNMMLMVTVGVLFVVCLIVDSFLFVQMRNYVDAGLARVHAEAMAQQVDEYLKSAALMQKEIRNTAMLRHDLRNHMQVVLSLFERNQRQEAQDYLAEVRHSLLDKSEDAGRSTS